MVAKNTNIRKQKDKKQRKSTKTYGNLWKPKKIYENSRKSKKINENCSGKDVEFAMKNESEEYGILVLKIRDLEY